MNDKLPLLINSAEYNIWRDSLIAEIERQRLSAAMQLNAATLQHYWWMGAAIIKKQQEHGWGKKVIELLSSDLIKKFGTDSGYSTRNLGYMKQFASEYPDFPILQVPLAKLNKRPFLQAALAKFPASEDGLYLQIPLSQITWYHHISLLPKVKDIALRAFYITETARQGWNRDVMLLQIDGGYHHSVGTAPNNFKETLPTTDSDLAAAVFKDPYNFGFVNMAKVKREKDLEDQLAENITDLLLEMGRGFAYVGRQYVLKVEDEECKIDLLMYHLHLHCYVAIELKVVEFIPEFASKLNYYISAIDDNLKTPQDNPTIGLLLCRSKNNTKVEYALRGMTQPLGVAEYQTQQIMDNLKSSLPTIEELEKGLQK